MRRDLIAILRGLKLFEACLIAEAIIESGSTIIEVPLNSSDAYKSIETMVKKFSNELDFGAGTVVSVRQVD